MKEVYKNIFKYATSELSQDAFLCWLIANVNTKDVREYSVKLLQAFTGIKSNDWNIVNVEKQYDKLDILIELEVNKERHILAIEDKTWSKLGSHQLKNHDVAIKKYCEDKKIPNGYKEDKILFRLDKNLEAIDDKGWKVFDMRDIYETFKDNLIDMNTNSIPNIIIRDWLEMFLGYHCARNGDLPNEVKEWERQHWFNFVENHLDKESQSILKEYGNWKLYFTFWFKLDNAPYMGLNARNIEKFKVMFSSYEKGDPIEEWKNKIRNGNGYYKLSNLRNDSNKKARQFATSSKMEEVKTIEDLKKHIKEAVAEYKKLFE